MKKVLLTTKEVLNLSAEIKSLNTEKDLSFATKFKLSKVAKQLKKITEPFEETRIAIINKYGEDKGEGLSLTGAKQEKKGWEELDQVLDTKNAINIKENLTSKDFKNLTTEKPYGAVYEILQD